MSNKHLVLFSSVALAITMAGTVRAATVFSNFGPGDTFQASDGYGVGFGSGFNNTFAQAMAFTPTGANYNLDEVELPLFQAFGTMTHNQLDLAVRLSDPTGLPGAVLEAFHLTNAIDGNTIVTATSSLHPLLLAGTQYWLSAALTNPTAQNDFAGWDKNSIGDASPHASFKNSGPWQLDIQPAGAFRIDGTPITTATPEPSSALLVAVALGALGVSRRAKLAWKP